LILCLQNLRFHCLRY